MSNGQSTDMNDGQTEADRAITGGAGTIQFVGLSDNLKMMLQNKLMQMKEQESTGSVASGMNSQNEWTVTYSECFDLMLDVQELINVGNETKAVTIFQLLNGV